MRNKSSRIQKAILAFIILILCSSFIPYEVGATATQYSLQSYAVQTYCVYDYIHVFGGYYVFVGMNSAGNGKLWVKTIASTGIPSTVNVSTATFDSGTLIRSPKLLQLDQTHFCIIYNDGTYTGIIKTYQISSTGFITPRDTETFSLACYIVGYTAYIDSNNIITFFYTGENGMGYIRTCHYDPAAQTVDASYSAYDLMAIEQWNSTGNIQKNGGSVVGVKLTAGADYACVGHSVNKKSTNKYYDNLTVITFNVLSNGDISVVSHVIRNDSYGTTFTAVGNTTRGLCIGRGYGDSLFLVYSDFTLTGSGGSYKSFQVMNETGNLFYVNSYAGWQIGGQSIVDGSYLYQTSSNIVTSLCQTTYAGTYYGYVQNISVSGAGVLAQTGAAYLALQASGASPHRYSKMVYLGSGRYDVLCAVPGYTLEVLYTMGFFSDYSGLTQLQNQTPSYQCNDYSGYQNVGIDFVYYDQENMISHPYIEFISTNRYTMMSVGVELLVGYEQQAIDPDPTNYLLYINGVFVSSATCLSQYGSDTYLLQWPTYNKTLNDAYAVFELVHMVAGTTHYPGVYWALGTAINSHHTSNPAFKLFPYAYQYYYSTTSHINGSLDGEYHEGAASPLWRLYYSSYGNLSEQTNYKTCTIQLVGFTTHAVYNIPTCSQYTTVFFDVFVNRTDSYYKLDLVRGAVESGSDQGYPITMYYPERGYQLTPETMGNYTIRLMHGTTVIVSDKFNVTTSVPDFALWSYPNPSDPGSNYHVAVFRNNSSAFTYHYICSFDSMTKASNVIYGLQNFPVNWWLATHTVDVVVPPGVQQGYEYWVLFGTNDNIFYVPILPAHQHIVLSGYADYIGTTLIDNTGVVDQTFRVIGINSHFGSLAKVFIDNAPYMDVSGKLTIDFQYSFSNVGNHEISLRILMNGTWTMIKSCIVKIATKQGVGTNPVNSILALIPSEYKIYIAIAVIVMFALLPLVTIYGYAVRRGVSVTIPALPLGIATIITGCAGWTLTIMWELMPWWSFFMMVFFVVLGIVFMYISQKKD